MNRVFDAQNGKITDALFAEAYRATIPVLADAQHVTVRIHSLRLKELSTVSSDISDVIEMGAAKDKRDRIIAVPNSVHIDDGAAIETSNADARTVSFEVNGIPEVQIVNLAVSTAEAQAEKSAADQAAKDQSAAAQKATDEALEKAKADAFEEGRKAALLEQAKQAGAASVQPAPKDQKVQ